ncbi:RHS repeat-associated core domain-containing protein [Streptomyces olivoreticuli]
MTDMADLSGSWIGKGRWLAGNRVQSGERKATYDARNRLQTDGDSTYTYSPRGTRKSSSSSGLAEESRFDAFGRLAKQGDISYEYDAFGRLVDRDGTEHTYSGLSDDVVADGRGVYSRGLTGELISVTQGGTTRLAMDDRHGDVVGTVDAKESDPKQLASSVGFDPFGKVTDTAGEQISIGYQGDWTDPSSKQVDMAARRYDSGTGAFTSRDSMTLDPNPSVQANRYTYANADPMEPVHSGLQIRGTDLPREQEVHQRQGPRREEVHRDAQPAAGPGQGASSGLCRHEDGGVRGGQSAGGDRPGDQAGRPGRGQGGHRGHEDRVRRERQDGLRGRHRDHGGIRVRPDRRAVSEGGVGLHG